MGLTAAIIARDEERHIGACLTSLAGLADETIVLLDARTRDRTAEVAAQHGAVVHREPWRGFPAQRNRALQLARGAWVLFVDADERVTPELAAEIRALVAGPGGRPGYWIPRHNLFFGRALRGGGWYPDHQLRLLRRGHARYDEGRLVHEFADLDGPAGELRGHLRHNNIEGLGELWAKQSVYALAEARTLYASGRRTRWRNLVGAPARELWRRYVLLGGWRDGALGLFLCATLAWFELVKFVFLRALAAGQHDAGGSRPPRQTPLVPSAGARLAGSRSRGPAGRGRSRRRSGRPARAG
jgi:glycosyltransferase involved in cell wall biosynthesis